MPTHPLAEYLADCRARCGTGAVTPETSLYPPLEHLLKAVGAKLKPRVHCFMSLKNQSGNIPDGGLFTHDQIARGTHEPPPGQAPARGVIECKPPKDDAWLTAETEQVSRKWQKYNQVLVTNYRDFLLVAEDPATGAAVIRETFRLADTETAFWTLNADKLAATRAAKLRGNQSEMRVAFYSANERIRIKSWHQVPSS